MTGNDVNEAMIEKVTKMLVGYKDLEKRAKQLMFEIRNFTPRASDDDLIDALTFGKPSDAGSIYVRSSKISDKTASVAEAYKSSAAALNKKHMEELENDLRVIHMEMMRLEFYIDLLGGNHARVIRALYIEGLTYQQAIVKIKISITTFKKMRREGILKLASMYQAIIANDAAEC